ncbi:MAG: hypothetical protein JWO03_1025, partial [Bacteroidetes bacterium]|nr:hypothetical protein [Bacteroidota bacterium]
MNGRKAARITWKTLAWTIGSVLVLLVALVLLIRLPPVQTYITHKVTAYVSSKTHTKVELRRLYIAFPKSVMIEQLYAEDTKHDTLLYLGKLKVSIDMLALLRHKVEVSSVMLTDVNANIERKEVDSTYNFGFIINAFAGNKKKAPEAKAKVDTSGAPWIIQVDKVDLAHIRGRFADHISGTTIQGEVGALQLDMKGMDIKKLSFTGHNLYLADAGVSIVQTLDNDAVRDSTVSLLPRLALDKIDIHRVKFSYEHKPRGQLYSFGVGDLFVLPGRIDLNEHTIQVKTVRLTGSDGLVALRRGEKESKPDPADTARRKGWYVNVDTVHLEHVDFAFDETNVPKKAYGVDYVHLKLTDVNTHIEKGMYSPEKILADIHNLSLHEQSGFELKKLSAKGEYNDNGATLKRLVLVTGYSSIAQSDLAMHYPSIKTLSTDVGLMEINADLKPVEVGVEDILYFVPQLREQLADMGGRKANVSGHIYGRLNDITANDLVASIGEQTSVSLNGHVTGLPKAKTAVYDVDIKNANSTKADLMMFLKGKLPASIDVPETFSISGKAQGSIANVKTKLALRTSAGNADIDASLLMAAGDTQYSVKLNVAALDLGYILKKPELLGTVTATIDGKGRNFSPSTIAADVSAKISSVYFKKYDYKDISLEACAGNGAYDAMINIRDTNVLVNMDAAMLWLKDEKRLQANADIKGIDLGRTNLLKNDVRTGAQLHVNLRDSADNINGTADVKNIIVLKGEDSYKIDSVSMVAKSDSGRAHFTMTSDIANADYQGTSSVQQLPRSLTTFINSYFSFTANKADTVTHDTTGQSFRLTANINPHPIITDLLLTQVKSFNGASVTADFDKDKRKLNLELHASALAYGGVKIENADVSVHSVNDSLKYDISVSHLTTGPVRLTSTEVSGSLKENRIAYLIDVKDSMGGDKLKTSGDFKQPSPKSYALHIDSNGLVLNNRLWKLADDNIIRFGAEGLNVHDFNLERYGQSISVASESEANNSPVKLVFKDFDIGTLSQIIESDTALLRGTMNGTAELRNLNGNPAFVSDLKIDSIAFQRHPIGNLTVKADNLSQSRYQAEINLTGADNNVEIKGAYITSTPGGSLDLHANINKLNLQSIEPFAAGQIRRSKGYLTGTASITGSSKHPLINGDIAFKDAACNVAYINNYITIKEDHIKIDPQGIYFNSFDILDSLGQKATINGSVHTTDFRKMKFDLSIRTDNFTVLNTT